MAGEISDEQVLAELQSLANTAAVTKENLNTHTFLNAVATSDDTIKVGNLKEEEVGVPKLSVRTLKELALYTRDIGADEEWATYFDKRAEILTSTSLSKDAKLLNLSVVNRVETANMTQAPRVKNKKWFQKKEPEQLQGG
jgi:hypothetical protein